MRVSAKCDYACRALLELALHWPSQEPLHIQDIAENQEIPMRYLVQILIQLKQMGLVASTRGKGGGYNLAKQPAHIRLGHVIREIGGSLLPVASNVSMPKSRNVFLIIWGEAEEGISRILDNITFADVCDRAKGLDRALTYAI